MTAPTQPPDPRVQRIADALCAYDVREMNATEAARVLVEELGGREGDKPVAPSFPVEWRFVLSVLDDIMPGWANGYMASGAIRAIAEERNACRAQQRENAETIQALRERVETAEAANTELDNARKSAEQSARNLRENNATLRAELDAIKGAQVPFITMRVMEGGAFSVVPGPAFAPIQIGVSTPMYLHPAPALPVVGACVVNTNGEVTHWWRDRWIARDGDVLEEIARKENGALHKLLLGDKIGAPLSTEGGK